MILIELTAAIDAAGATQTFYVADDRFATAPTDTPASVAFEPRLLDPGSLGRHAYSDGRTGGATRLETGEIIIANADGALDGWIGYSFDARPVTIRQGSAGAYPGGFITLLSATADGIEANGDKIVVRLRDRQYLFDQPVCTAAYAGNNSLPNGLEGTADDLKGSKKPRGWGKVYNFAAPCVNTSRNIFEVGACQSVNAVYEGGAVLTAGAAYTSQSDMETNVPAAGTFRAWAAGGYYRINTTPSAQITADVTYSTAGNSTAAQIIKALALDAGIAGGDISSSDVTALDTACSYVLGIVLRDDSSYLRALDDIANSIGAWYGFDTAGVLRMGRLAAPSDTPALTLNEWDVLAIERRPPRDGGGIPIWRATVAHSRNYTVQTSGLLGAATAARRAWVAEDYRRTASEDASIKTQWKLSGAMEAETLITAAADAAAESARLRDLYKLRRDVFDITVPAAAAAGIDLMAVGRVVYPRFGLAAGRDFRLIGQTLDLARDRITLTLWG
jgi:hypothetical protein